MTGARKLCLAKIPSALLEAKTNDSTVHDTAFAEYVLTNPGRLWGEAALEQKQRLQKVLFPRGVTCSTDGAFKTAETSMIFRLLQALPTEKTSEASPTVPSWNQILVCLREFDLLRQACAA